MSGEQKNWDPVFKKPVFAENVKNRKFPIEEKSHFSSRTLENFCP